MRFTTSLTPVAGLMALALAAAGFAPPGLANDSPDRAVGPQPDGTIVVSTNQTITQEGKIVNLGSPVRAKAVALDPNHNIGAVLLMGAAHPVELFDLTTGKLLQHYIPASGDNSGSYTGITYAADGKHLYFSQDGNSTLTIAAVDAATGQLSDAANVALPPDTSIPLYSNYTAYPGGIAVSADSSTAYVLLNQNNTLGVINLAGTPSLTKQIRVGNVPHSVVLANGKAYVSNEGGRIATASDFTDISSGTPIVTNPATDSASTGTVTVIDPVSGHILKQIGVGLHPTGMALSGSLLFVANASSESVSIIDTSTDRVIRTIYLKVPVSGGYGSNPCSIVVNNTVMYVTLATANAVAVVDLSSTSDYPVLGYIPTAYFPTTIALDAVNHQLVVSSDKGTGSRGIEANAYGVKGYNTHRDTGVVNLIPIPSPKRLGELSATVFQNNHWNNNPNTHIAASYANTAAAPKAIPEHIGEPSKINHVFLIIKENRTYDQIFGANPKGDGDAKLGVFTAFTPNQQALVTRFPLLDNTYAPSRQSADGHPWIVSGISAYADDIQSPDWVRSYPGGNSNDAMVYTPKGFLWQAATARGLSVKMYGEWSGNQSSGNYSWSEWYQYSQYLEGVLPSNPTTITATTDVETSTVPSVTAILDPHYPSFNTGIPDQYRVDYWLPKFNADVAGGTVPNLTIMWLPDDHTSGFYPGYPIPTAAQADNDLALGRIVEAISHSNIWGSTAIFVEEDDAQNGVDHVDGHRQPAFVISPYATQTGAVDHTNYGPANINRTIEQILGMKPLTQFDLVASPMWAAFQETANTAPFTHVAPTQRLDTFPTTASADSVQGVWMAASGELFKDKYKKADAVDSTTLNHLIWYATTGWHTPYPGEKTVRMPGEFNLNEVDDDGDGI